MNSRPNRRPCLAPAFDVAPALRWSADPSRYNPRACRGQLIGKAQCAGHHQPETRDSPRDPDGSLTL